MQVGNFISRSSGRQLDAIFPCCLSQVACFGLNAYVIHIFAHSPQGTFPCRINPDQAAFLNREFLSVHKEDSVATEDDVQLLIFLMDMDKLHASSGRNAVE